MILSKLIIPLSLLTISSQASISFASEKSSQDSTTSAWYTSTSSSPGSPDIAAQFSATQGWLYDKWSGQSILNQMNDQGIDIADTSQWAVDIKRRLLSAKENTYFAMGLGWKDIELAQDESSSGMRFVAEGRVGIYGPAYLFGQAAVSPWMTDAGSHTAPFGKELDLGMGLNPLPSMSFRAGYRSYWFDTSDSSNESILKGHTDGFYIGGGLHW